MNKAFRPWAFWRQVQYGGGCILTVFLLGVGVYYLGYYQVPTCFDNIQNANETGVDCGNGCVRVCAADVLPPRVVWTQSFEIEEGRYNALAYVENPNQTTATPELPYTFELLDESGAVIASVSDTTVLPPNSVYPIFAGRLFTDGKRAVADTRLTLGQAELWQPASVGRDQFRSVDIALVGADTKPKLTVAVENQFLTDAAEVEIVATIFNDLGEPVTASQTFVDSFAGRTTEDIVFTWPNSIAKTVRSCFIPTDVVVGIDLSGSMNNDGGDPPEPVTSALRAAHTFVNNLKDKDQVSLVTFATAADTLETLTNAHISVATKILAATIAPAEEVGYTNTAAALDAANSELGSARHNADARRVLVLLTDGLPTAKGDFDAVAAAEASAEGLRAAGVEIYAIGLGTEVDQQFIEQIASRPDTAFLAPTADQLERIYTEISTSLCEVGPPKIDVIAKTKTNFTPLQ